MAKTEPTAYAFHGSGVVDVGNAASLLDDYLSQNVRAAFVPRIPRSERPKYASLTAVTDWLESPDILGPKGTITTGDLLADLVHERDENDVLAELIVLWPEEPSEEDKALVTAAREAGVKVVSLGDAIDDLLWEPEAEKPAPAAAEQPAAAVEDAVTEKLMTAIEGDFGVALAAMLEGFVRRIVREELGIRPAPAEDTNVADPAAVEKVAARLAGRTEDTPPFDPPYKAAPEDDDLAVERVAYWENEDKSSYRKKTGSRRRKGEREVMLTLEQVDEYVRAGKIIDN